MSPDPAPADREDRLIGIDEVLELVSFKRSKLYKLIREKRFPQHCKPGGYGSAWSLNEVRAWRDQQLAARG